MTQGNLPILPPVASPFGVETERIKSHISASGKAPVETRRNQLKSATQEFEALFLSYMLKVMRSTVDSEKEDDSSSLGKDIYMDMFDNEIALNIARVRGLGIGEMLYRQLTAPNMAVGDSKSDLLSKRDNTDSPSMPLATSLDSGSDSPPLETLRTTGGATFVTPVEGVLTSAYGPRKDPLTQESQFHRGLDIAASPGTPFRAAQSGIVVFSGFLGAYGNTIILEHADGSRTLYAHAAKLLVTGGANVQAEQEIGIVGSTGRSTGAHLHFELQRRGLKADPRELLTSLK